MVSLPIIPEVGDNFVILNGTACILLYFWNIHKYLSQLCLKSSLLSNTVGTVFEIYIAFAKRFDTCKELKLIGYLKIYARQGNYWGIAGCK